MNKTYKIVFVSLGVVLLAAAVFFTWKYGNGLKPVLLPPPEDIVNLLPGAPATATEDSVRPQPGSIIPPSAVNNTSMPLKLHDGFGISVFASGLGGPRALAIDPDGNLLASIPSSGKVVALPDGDVNGTADNIVTVISGLKRPHGLAFRCEGNAAVQQCYLYVAESHQIVMYEYNRAGQQAINGKKIFDMPDSGGHFTRTIGFGPDGRLYVSIGSSCNVCNETEDKRAKIFSMNADGGDAREFARGLRNSVFFTWSPFDGKMWATDNGRDHLGDELPPDEINIVEEGQNYGWPVCYGKNVHDSNFDKNTYKRNPCMAPFEQPSHIDLPAHSAALGLAFIPPDSTWPEAYRGDLLIAFHGSWNRSEPTGYKIALIKLGPQGQHEGMEDFISGWLTADNRALGRPVGILTLSGGVAYITDDKAGVIYRLTVLP